jgi:hypothetical protein
VKEKIVQVGSARPTCWSQKLLSGLTTQLVKKEGPLFVPAGLDLAKYLTG